MTTATAQKLHLPAAPFVSSVMQIEPQWIDYNGHLNMAYYNVLFDRGIVTPEVFERLERAALELFAFGQAEAALRGLILVDTKYELGVAPDGRVVLIDEIHTPDSSRYWYADGYDAALAAGEDPRALDKEFVRRWLVARGFSGDQNGTAKLITEAIRHPGFSFVQLLSPCVTFRPEQRDWKDMVHPAAVDPTDDPARAARRLMSDDGFNVGVLFRGSRKPFQPGQPASVDSVADLEKEFVL